MSKTALIVVDVQNDFLEGGSLPVTGGKQVAEDIADYLTAVQGEYLVIYTRDYHVPGSDNGGHFSDTPDYVDTWPPHCVQGTPGALYAPALHDVLAYNDGEFVKGMEKPAYSGFEGHLSTDRHMPLAEYLRLRGVTEVAVCGLAADYCVRATALDAIKEGFRAHVITNLTASISTPVDDVFFEVEKANL